LGFILFNHRRKSIAIALTICAVGLSACSSEPREPYLGLCDEISYKSPATSLALILVAGVPRGSDVAAKEAWLVENGYAGLDDWITHVQSIDAPLKQLLAQKEQLTQGELEKVQSLHNLLTATRISTALNTNPLTWQMDVSSESLALLADCTDRTTY
jgi:hypothetical protein